MKENGIVKRQRPTGIVFKEHHKVARYNFGKQMLAAIDEDPEFHRRIIFSDEKMVRLAEFDSVKYYYSNVKRCDVFLARSQKLMKGCMFWACFSFQGKGPLATIDGRMNAADYQNLLQNQLVPKLEASKGIFDPIFMHDNAPIHRAKSTSDWLISKGIKKLEWPACSPDLNPIEDVWALIHNKLSKIEFPGSIDELENIFIKEWQNFPEETLKKLADSFKERMVKVVRNNGELINKTYVK
eukprot:NODE_348_length_8996_cov_0.416433.p2 type:complete len:240 gc:universal NODE_348_length_8996_cov_0.416433:4558-5277(+)